MGEDSLLHHPMSINSLPGSSSNARAARELPSARLVRNSGASADPVRRPGRAAVEAEAVPLQPGPVTPQQSAEQQMQQQQMQQQQMQSLGPNVPEVGWLVGGWAGGWVGWLVGQQKKDSCDSCGMCGLTPPAGHRGNLGTVDPTGRWTPTLAMKPGRTAFRVHENHRPKHLFWGHLRTPREKPSIGKKVDGLS